MCSKLDNEIASVARIIMAVYVKRSVNTTRSGYNVPIRIATAAYECRLHSSSNDNTVLDSQAVHLNHVVRLLIRP